MRELEDGSRAKKPDSLVVEVEERCWRVWMGGRGNGGVTVARRDLVVPVGG
jgi:hypothetical protein